MFGMVLRVFAAVGVFAGIHSLLASGPAKEFAARQLGQRNRAGLYRGFYIFQSFVTIWALLAYLLRLPDRALYHVRGPLAWLMRAGQAAGLVFATAAAYQVGLLRITGLAPLWSWLRGERDVPPEPEAQGPAPEEVSASIPLSARPRSLRARGPFRWTRHPLNLSPLPVFWLTPRMTLKRLAFNLAGTAYLFIGSLHEEARLLRVYGPAYRDYQRSGVPFYLPIKITRE